MTTSTNCRVRFMENNFAELTSGSVTYSSQLSDFPATNAYQNKFRSKVWKTSGHFLIEADVNDLIYINDGADKTATLTAGSYTTPELMAAEVQTQLNTVSSGWTFEYVRTGDVYGFKFSHGSAHTLRFSQTTEAAWDTLGFTKSTDTAISTSESATEPRIHTGEYIQFDFGYNAQIDFLGIVGPLDEEFTIPESATVTLKANNLDNRWDTAPLSVTLTPTAFGIFKFFDDIADTNYRYWRVDIEDRENSGGNGPSYSVGYLYLGDYLTFTDKNIANGFVKTLVDDSIVQRSENGALYFDTKTKYHRYTNSSIGLIDKDQRETMERMYNYLGNTTPFFISLDPQNKISPTGELYHETKYIRFSKPPKFTHVIRDLFNMSLEFEEIL